MDTTEQKQKRVIAASSDETNRLSNNEPTYIILWARLKKLRSENQHRLGQLKQIAARFESEIKPLECALMHCLFDQTELLIHHYSATELDTAERSLLGLWITDHHTTLGEHPFAQHLPLESMYQKWQSVLTIGDSAIDKHLASFSATSHEKIRAKQKIRNANEQPQSNTASNTEFTEGEQKEHLNTERFSDKSCGDIGAGNASNNEAATSRFDSLAPEDIDDALESLLSVDKLFRKLAHALHPDREQDTLKKESKHELMRECLEARDNKDITALLILYDNHIGGLPSLATESDIAELESVLRKEITALQNERAQLQSSGSLQSQIIERYAADNAAETNRRFEDHIVQLETRKIKMDTQSEHLSKRSGLLEELASRREIEMDKLVIRELTGVAEY